MTLVEARAVAASDVRFTRPYKGLDFFTDCREDALLFFGRDTERKIIISNLLASRLTVLYGESGVGKSSLLHAGVAFHLREQAAETAIHDGVPEHAVVIFRSWPGDPIEGLTKAVADAVTDALGSSPIKPVSETRPLDATLEAWSEHLGGELLVILDQFEEYFLYHPDEDGPGTFAFEFPRAINQPGLHAKFLVAIREDALAKLDRFKGRVPSLFDNYLRIDHLDHAAAREAIEQPLERYKGSPATHGPTEIEPLLVKEVLEQVQLGRLTLGPTGLGRVDRGAAADAGSDRVEELYLQMVMDRLWNVERENGFPRLRLETLNALHGAESIVRAYLDEAIDELDDDEKAIAAGAFAHLVTPAAGKIALTAGELADEARLPEEDLKPVLEKLREAHVLNIDQSTEPRYEILHDAFAKAILEWRRRFQQARADREQRDKERREQVTKFGLVGAIVVTALLVLVTALFFWARTQRDDAKREATKVASVVLAFDARRQLRLNLDNALLLGLAANLSPATKEVRDVMIAALAAARGSGPRLIVRAENSLSDVAFASDGRTFATARGGRTVRLWDAGTGKPLGRARCGGGAGIAVALSANGRMLACAVAHGAEIWDVRRRRRLGRLALRRPREVSAVAFSPDGKTLAAAVDNGTLRLMSVRSGGPGLRGQSRALKPTSEASGASSVVIAPNGLTIASSGTDGTVRLWDVRAHAQRGKPLIAQTVPVNAVAFSPDGRTLASGGTDGKVRLWDVRTRTGKTLGDHQGRRVESVAFSSDGRTLASSGADRTVRLWDVHATDQGGERLLRHTSVVKAVAFTGDGGSLVSAGTDGTVRRWDVTRAGQPNELLFQAKSAVNGVAFSPNGRALAFGGDDGVVRLWDVNGRRELRQRLLRHDGPVYGIAFNPNGNTLASGGSDGIRFWDVNRRTQLRPALTGVGTVYGVAFSPDGRTLASAGADGRVRLWDVAERTQIDEPLLRQGPSVNAVAFSADGRTLASAGADGKVQLWNVGERRRLGEPLVAQTAAVNGVAFGPDGSTLASAGSDGTVRLWDVNREGQVGNPLLRSPGYVYGVAFSPARHALVSVGADGKVWLWKGIFWRDLSDLTKLVCSLGVGSLSREEWDKLAPGVSYRETCTG